VACQDWANTKAAYRFWQRTNQRGEYPCGHFASTRERFLASGGDRFWCSTTRPNSRIVMKRRNRSEF